MRDGNKKLTIRKYLLSWLKASQRTVLLFLATFVLLLSSCSSPLEALNFDGVNILPSLRQLDFTAVQPSQSFDYWEFRQVGGDAELEIIASGGLKSKSELSQNELTALNSTTPNSGFNLGCHGQKSTCHKYIITIDSNQVKIWNTGTDIAAFLGQIDNLNEAVVLANANSYIWDGQANFTSGYIERNGNYEMVVLRLINLCRPVQSERVHIIIKKDATIETIASEVWQTLGSNCLTQ